VSIFFIPVPPSVPVRVVSLCRGRR
jgi:hypothetical protein